MPGQGAKCTLSLPGHKKKGDSSSATFLPSAIAIQGNLIIRAPVVQFNLTEHLLRVCCTGSAEMKRR